MSYPNLMLSLSIHLDSITVRMIKLINSSIIRELFQGFKQNQDFHNQMRKLRSDGEKFCKKRRLDPNNPDSTYKGFYHSRIIEEFDKYYERRK